MSESREDGCAAMIIAFCLGVAVIIIAMGGCQYLVSKGVSLEKQQPMKGTNDIKEEKR